MKKIILLIITGFYFNVNAQTAAYHPFLDSVNRWTFVENIWPIMPENTNCPYPFNGGYMFTTDDTVINSLTYKKLIVDSFCIFGYMREDTSTRTVYFMDNNFNPEILLYDFNMQAGDSVALQFMPDPYPYWQDGYYFLDSIGSVSTLLGNRSVLYLNCVTCSNSHTLAWVEGIGNLANPVYPFIYNVWGGGGGPFTSYCFDFPNNMMEFMICFEHYQKVYYDSCAYNSALNYPFLFEVFDSCNYRSTASGVSGNEFSNSVTLSSPFHDIAVFHIKDQTSADYLFTIYDVTGHLIREEIIKNKYQNIERKSLSDGLYIFNLAGEDGFFATGKFVVQ